MVEMDWRKGINTVVQKVNTWFSNLPQVPRDTTVSLMLFCAAYYVSNLLMEHSGGQNTSTLVYVLAVTLISLVTTGYVYGIVASVVSALFINIYFMEPFDAFSLSRVGYPVTMLSIITISCVVCALTARVKHQAAEAVRREKKTKALYEQNEKLSQEKAAIQLASDRETIRGNILRAVSHDLRTPLTSISGAAAVLLNSSTVTEKNRAMLNDIKEDADALIIMVENLLSVTRIQDGTMPLKKREEMLEEVAGDAVLTTHRRFPHSDIRMELEDDLLFLPMEPILVKQVIVNLLENAIRHSGSSEPITLRLFREENRAVVEVRDRGVGLSEEVCRAVKSGQAVTKRQAGDSTRGMGIGLSVCHSIIKAHDGVFEAENDPKGGAVFRFGLPMEEPSDE